MHKNGPGPTGWARKSALAALPRLEIAPLFPAHGALLSLISGPNATVANFETASKYYWDIAATFLQRANIDESTLMGFPCLRINGDFFSTCDHRSGDLIVKLRKDRVSELIDAGRGEPFAPSGRVFKEWVLIKRRNKKTWIALMDESLSFVSQ